MDNEGYNEFMQQPYEVRHTEENQKKWGAWRWRSIYENKYEIDHIRTMIQGFDTQVLDVGGAKGPLFHHADIVDREDLDVFGCKVKYKSLSEINRQYDLIFSSHYLEHIENPFKEVIKMISLLRVNGYLVLNLPSILGEDYWHPTVKHEHKWIFSAWDDEYRYADKTKYIDNRLCVIPIGSFLERLRVGGVTVRYSGDCCLFVIARKR